MTDKIPKALIQVQEKPLIEHHVINLAKANFSRIVINHAYLGSQIKNYLGNGDRYGVEICYSAEPIGALETGGGIVNALPLLGEKPFVTVNADIFTDFPFNDLPLTDLNTMHVVLVPKNPQLLHHGDFGLQGSQLTNTPKQYIFSGITCYHPDVFAGCKHGRYSVIALVRRYIEEKRVSGQLYQGIWHDIGSIERLQVVQNKEISFSLGKSTSPS